MIGRPSRSCRVSATSRRFREMKVLTVAGVVLVWLVPGCGPGSEPGPLSTPPEGYAKSYAVADCAPWDGPAVTLYLFDSAVDSVTATTHHLRISIWKPLAEVQGRTFSWPADAARGGAVRCVSEESCQPIAVGTIRFRPAEPDSSVSGYLRLRFGAADSVVGGFRAAWRSRRVMCG